MIGPYNATIRNAFPHSIYEHTLFIEYHPENIFRRPKQTGDLELTYQQCLLQKFLKLLELWQEISLSKSFTQNLRLPEMAPLIDCDLSSGNGVTVS